MQTAQFELDGMEWNSPRNWPTKARLSSFPCVCLLVLVSPWSLPVRMGNPLTFWRGKRKVQVALEETKREGRSILEEKRIKKLVIHKFYPVNLKKPPGKMEFRFIHLESTNILNNLMEIIPALIQRILIFHKLIGKSYQRYLDVIENIESSNISEDEKIEETQRATNAREEAFKKQYGDTTEFIHKRYPPWCKA